MAVESLIGLRKESSRAKLTPVPDVVDAPFQITYTTPRGTKERIGCWSFKGVFAALTAMRPDQRACKMTLEGATFGQTEAFFNIRANYLREDEHTADQKAQEWERRVAPFRSKGLLY